MRTDADAGWIRGRRSFVEDEGRGCGVVGRTRGLPAAFIVVLGSFLAAASRRRRKAG